jgi:hypothetical protein
VRSASNVLVALCLTAVAASSCAGPRRTTGVGALEARYLFWRARQQGRVPGQPTRRPETSTRVYRNVLAQSIFSQCRMFPSDSELYDLRAARCGATPAAVMGIARVLLEVTASSQALPALIVDGRVRWLDLPPGDHPCAP